MDTQKRIKWLGLTLFVVLVAGALYLLPQQIVDDQSVDEEVVATDKNPSSSTSFTGSECESTTAMYCAELNTLDWMTWCTSQVESWRALGVDAINPCANSKYAHDSCAEAAIASGNAAQACEDYMTALNTSSADVQTACLYTTKPGGVCEGVTPAPVKPGTAPEDVVVPFDDCLEEHYETLTLECQEAFDYHQEVSRSETR